MRFYAPITVFILAVLAPCIAMSVLALRAAEREAMYVERRMETSLLAEVDLTSAAIGRLMSDVTESLRLGAIDEWAGNPLAGVRFTLSGERLDLSGGSDDAVIFRNIFEGFLLRGEHLPVYELVTRVFRTSDTPPQPEITALEDPDVTQPLQMSREQTAERGYSQQAPSSGIARQMNAALLETDPSAEEMIFEQVESEGFETYARNVAPQAFQAPRPSLAAPEELMRAPVRQQIELPEYSPEEYEPALDAATDYTPFDLSRTFRSRTVSMYRSFGELNSEASSGLLPNITEYGFELLFWTKTGEDRYAGCALRMDVLRDMIADILPDVISDARILTVLDESGNPIVSPGEFPIETPDWSSPFIAREISPLLPRWEVGAWLADPGSLESRANFARFFAWFQVAALGSVILSGSAVVIRMMSYEMRVASQKATFAANVSHELKTPLTSIRLYAELLSSGRQTDEKRRLEYLRTMVSEAERLSNLVDNVLTFSRRGKGTKEDMKSEPVSLADLARETVSQIEPRLEKLGFSVICRFAGEETENLSVKGSREALKQVLVNLLSNAEKYSGESREITVELERGERSAAIRVLDRGIGIPIKMSEKIFHEFVRGDDSLSAPAGGAGLGLSIARDIARRHGGDVAYYPRSGGGSVFVLTLPLFNERGNQS